MNPSSIRRAERVDGVKILVKPNIPEHDSSSEDTAHINIPNSARSNTQKSNLRT
jgi:hypothetical protein